MPAVLGEVTSQTDRLALWGSPEPPRVPGETPRRFLAVSAERQLLDEGHHLSRQEAERILARLGRS